MRSTILFLAGIAAIICPDRLLADEHSDAYRFLFDGMWNERAKLQSGVCRATGTYVYRHTAKENPPAFEGPISISAAFDSGKIRFERSQPGWVSDPTTGKSDPQDSSRAIGGKSMKGTIRFHFADDGKKAATWLEDGGPYIHIGPAQRDIPVGISRGQFMDLRGLGLYDYVSGEGQYKLKGLFEYYRKLAQGDLKPKVDRSNPDQWVIEWNSAPGVVQIVVNVRDGFTPVRHITRHRHPKDASKLHVAHDIVTTWSNHGGVWYPVRYWNRFSPGGDGGSEIDLTLEWEGLNQKVDSGLFDYRSFQAPDYVGVIESSLGRSIIVKPSTAPRAGELPSSSWPAIVIVSVIILGLGAVGVALWRRRVRRSRPIVA